MSDEANHSLHPARDHDSLSWTVVSMYRVIGARTSLQDTAIRANDGLPFFSLDRSFAAYVKQGVSFSIACPLGRG